MRQNHPMTTLAILAAVCGLAAALPAQAQAQDGSPIQGPPIVISTPQGQTPPGGDEHPRTPSTGDDLALEWFSIDGGGRMYLTAGEFEMGSTVGQPDTGYAFGDCFEFTGGFWAIVAPAACYANCDHSTTAPILNVADFSCFLQHYAAGDCYANCDDSTQTPTLNVADFSCFLTKYAAGCP
jgi:hypothetical protein